MGGRVALTTPSTCADQCDVTVVSSVSGVSLESATVWKVGSPWVSKEQVLATPRMDGGNVQLMADRIHAQQQAD